MGHRAHGHVQHRVATKEEAATAQTGDRRLAQLLWRPPDRLAPAPGRTPAPRRTECSHARPRRANTPPTWPTSLQRFTETLGNEDGGHRGRSHEHSAEGQRSRLAAEGRGQGLQRPGGRYLHLPPHPPLHPIHRRRRPAPCWPRGAAGPLRGRRVRQQRLAPLAKQAATPLMWPQGQGRGSSALCPPPRLPSSQVWLRP